MLDISQCIYGIVSYETPLSAAKLNFFLNPLRAEIIQSFKSHYGQLRRDIDLANNCESSEISLKEAIRFSKVAWDIFQLTVGAIRIS